jgi:prefoldin subunit 5
MKRQPPPRLEQILATLAEARAEISSLREQLDAAQARIRELDASRRPSKVGRAPS